MKLKMTISHSIAAALVAGGALLAAGSASAQMRYDVSPQPAYDAPHAIPVDVNVSIGWHGDRYWDGHRYWEHDEWMHHHPHDRDPHRDHDEHGDHQDYRQ